MKHTLIVTPAGEELVLISKSDFDRIEDMLDVAAYDAAKAKNAEGGEALSAEEMKALLDAPTPLAFWRSRRGLKRKDLAEAAGISANYVPELEAGKRKGDPALIKRLAAALGVGMEDLVVDDGGFAGPACLRRPPAYGRNGSESEVGS